MHQNTEKKTKDYQTCQKAGRMQRTNKEGTFCIEAKNCKDVKRATLEGTKPRNSRMKPEAGRRQNDSNVNEGGPKGRDTKVKTKRAARHSRRQSIGCPGGCRRRPVGRGERRRCRPLAQPHAGRGRRATRTSLATAVLGCFAGGRARPMPRPAPTMLSGTTC